jgi:uncharacterized membrane protein YidH (DUF202 family)
MDFSIGALAAGLVFGIFGMFIFREGKRESNFKRLLLGITLMAYGWFVPNPWAAWGIGLTLLWINHFTNLVNNN